MREERGRSQEERGGLSNEAPSSITLIYFHSFLPKITKRYRSNCWISVTVGTPATFMKIGEYCGTDERPTFTFFDILYNPDTEGITGKSSPVFFPGACRLVGPCSNVPHRIQSKSWPGLYPTAPQSSPGCPEVWSSVRWKMSKLTYLNFVT